MPAAIIGGLGLGAALLAVALSFPVPRSARPSAGAPASDVQSRVADAFDVQLSTDAGPAHPVYRNSVVAGGVHSPQDVYRAVASDRVVRDHYADVSLANLKVVRASSGRDAYMSYRIGDRVFWTSKRVPLNPGETLLTDGTMTIRARCGNLVSDEAMLPTSPDEPSAAVLDTIAPAMTAAAGDVAPSAADQIAVGDAQLLASAGPLVAEAGTPGGQSFGEPALGAFAGGGGGAGSTGVAGFVATGGGGTSVAPPPGGSSDPSLPPDTDTPPNGPPSGSPPGFNPPGSNPPGTNPPGTNPPGTNPPGTNPPGTNPPGSNPPGSNPPGSNPPDSDPPWPNPPGFNPPGWNPPGPGGPGSPDGPDDPDVPPGFDPEPPLNQPVPVPEPASLLLFGSGLALTAWRARKARQKKSQQNIPE